MRGAANMGKNVIVEDFPSFSEGLSLRAYSHPPFRRLPAAFPFLFGGTFIEGCRPCGLCCVLRNFPSFSEGLSLREYEPLTALLLLLHFPSFSEGLSLRERRNDRVFKRGASFPFPFRRDFH